MSYTYQHRINHRFPSCSIAVLAVLLCGECTLGAEPFRPAIHELTFGASRILENCWTLEERLGRPEDRLPSEKPRSKTASAGPLSMTTILPPLKREWMNSIRRVEPFDNRKVVALTFDLCETSGARTGYDAAVVNVLRKYEARAMFFAGGRWMQTHPDKAKQLMADPLFEIGNHSWNHPVFSRLEGDRIRDQILRTQAQYELLRAELSESPCAKRVGVEEVEKIPRVPTLFRFPYGVCGPEPLRIVSEAGLAAVQWDVVMGDPAPGQKVSSMIDRVLGSTRPGSIVVGHANGRGHGTAEALEAILPRLAARGFRFVTVSELLLLGRPVTAGVCYELTPGDNVRYEKTHTQPPAPSGAGRGHGGRQ